MNNIYKIGNIVFSVNRELREFEKNIWDNFITKDTSIDFSVDITDCPSEPTGELIYDSKDCKVYAHDDSLNICRYSQHGTLMGQFVDNGTTSYRIYNRNGIYSKLISSAYIIYGTRHDTLSIHASCIRYKGRGYIWVGESGRGKSTHSRMWLESVEGAELLNDDNPILSVDDDKVYVSGSPWSGKTECYRNISAPLEGIVQLRRGKTNKIVRVPKLRAMSIILPCIIGDMKWNHETHNKIIDLIGSIVEKVPVYEMWCTATKEAALVCREAVADNK